MRLSYPISIPYDKLQTVLFTIPQSGNQKPKYETAKSIDTDCNTFNMLPSFLCPNSQLEEPCAISKTYW
jgi:hypothetical protein